MCLHWLHRVQYSSARMSHDQRQLLTSFAPALQAQIPFGCMQWEWRHLRYSGIVYTMS